MVRPTLAFAFATLTILTVLSRDARHAGVWANDEADCTDGIGDTQIRGCSQVIASRRLFAEPISKKHLAIAHGNRGNAYMKKGNYDRAIADYDAAIKLNPKLANAYNYRGNAYERKGNKKRAIVDYRKALMLNPSNQTTMNNLKRLGASP